MVKVKFGVILISTVSNKQHVVKLIYPQTFRSRPFTVIQCVSAFANFKSISAVSKHTVHISKMCRRERESETGGERERALWREI